MKIRALVLFVFAAAMMVSPIFGNESDSAKNRMRERVSVIDSLKQSGVVGENNRGFLELRKSEENASKVVQDENADRQVVFAATAARINNSAEAVGRSFAKQIAAASSTGVWLQKESGDWYQK
jgi:uncharacterized protein YdbL (DUF1318 family)